MFEHLAPPELQRCQRKLKLIGDEPDHDPLDAVSVPPTDVLPEIVGAAVLAGAVRCAPCAAPPRRSSPAPTTSATRLDMPGVFPPTSRSSRCQTKCLPHSSIGIIQTTPET